MTDSADVALGTCAYTAVQAANLTHIECVFTISGSKTFAFQMYSVGTQGSYGGGAANNIGTEVYSAVTIMKL